MVSYRNDIAVSMSMPHHLIGHSKAHFITIAVMSSGPIHPCTDLTILGMVEKYTGKPYCNTLKGAIVFPFTVFDQFPEARGLRDLPFLEMEDLKPCQELILAHVAEHFQLLTIPGELRLVLANPEPTKIPATVQLPVAGFPMGEGMAISFEVAIPCESEQIWLMQFALMEDAVHRMREVFNKYELWREYHELPDVARQGHYREFDGKQPEEVPSLSEAIKAIQEFVNVKPTPKKED